jgi:predicted nucleic acid-binding protein
MILIPDNEYAAVLDACVLAPMPICDTLLRVAYEGMYRPVWSKQILKEVRAYLSQRYTEEQVQYRLTKMKEAFPEACVRLPDGFTNGFQCIPDENDRHVMAAAVKGQAHVIVTFNTRDFLMNASNNSKS